MFCIFKLAKLCAQLCSYRINVNDCAGKWCDAMIYN